MATSRKRADELRAASKLAVDATQRVTRVVEDMHRTIASGPPALGRPLALPARVLTSVVYGWIRGVTGLVGMGVDAALAPLTPLLGESAPSEERAAVVAALNGVIGDYLVETSNPLATEMVFCHEGRELVLRSASLREVFPDTDGRLLVLVHGSGMHEGQWAWRGHDHGAALARELGFSAIYLRYNSGLHISENGRAFAALLEELVAAWPVPVKEISILGHSMGGLVARSACRAAESAGLAWRSRLVRYVSLGTPHHGSPLERAGNIFHSLLGVSSYSAPIARLARLRSAGVTDLRFGNVLDEHWEGKQRFDHEIDTRASLPLPDGVACHAIAASLSRSDAAKPRGDGLVPIPSALGKHERSELGLDFPEANQWIAFETGHLDLLNRPEVYERLRSWFAGTP
jgi:pimeloyl-ACP methyl ester carboxylesterase